MAAYAYIDVSRKQAFIYKHNKLSDNLNNSFIIKSVTEKMEGMDSEEVGISLSGYLQKYHPNQSEVVHSGGGNSIVRFKDLAQGKAFVQGYSREVLKAYPDLELYISLVNDTEEGIGDGEEQEKQIRALLYKKADQLKEKRRARFRRWTYGVEKIDETGQAERSNEGEPRQHHKLSRNYLHQRFEQRLAGTRIKITSELQHYKKNEEGKSYIGVLVIDGNRMGEMLQRISTFERLTAFGKEVENIYQTAVIDALKSFDRFVSGHKEVETSPSFYVTPILMAGDDICLITEAEYAIEIAAKILQNIEGIYELEKQRDSFIKEILSGGAFTACAGVAIVKYTYPFFEAVKAAEALCHRAKEMRYRAKDKEGRPADVSFIDWEILQGQVERDKAYENYVKHGRDGERFHIKPLCIGQQQAVTEEGIYSYKAFMRLVGKIRRDEEVSTSLLEDLKRNLYGGWEQYELFFEMRQGSKRLTDIVQDIFGDSCICRNAARISEEGRITSYTYILNDVLDVLPFMSNQEVGAYVTEAEL